jgi:thymidine phosphorylase
MIRMPSPLPPDSYQHATLQARPMGIDTYQEPVIYMRADCPVCRSEGFESQSRVRVSGNSRSLVATLNVVRGDLLGHGEAGLSEVAWILLGADTACPINVSHPEPVESYRYVRAKLFGRALTSTEVEAIVRDIAQHRYSDVQMSAFLAACVGDRMSADEVVALTRAMVAAGQRLNWDHSVVFDKHCVGGLPGNRTTPIVVAIATVCGVVVPKTSSRAITSPAGTADTMETLTRVDLSLEEMRRVVDQEGGCLVWGGSVDLSPADDILIRVERALDVDSEAQLVASVLSKKIAAGSTHTLIDIPVGPTAKVRDQASAERLSFLLKATGAELGLAVEIAVTDGTQPVGRGIGPALEARDVLAVLQGEPDAPKDLRMRAAHLAGRILELSGNVDVNEGTAKALKVLDDGRAWEKFKAICDAQGGLRKPPIAGHRQDIVADKTGRITAIDNRRLAKVAKLAGAPTAPAAGVELHVQVGDVVEANMPVLTVHAEAPGELTYALGYLVQHPGLMYIGNSDEGAMA